MGFGGGQFVLSRDQHDPGGPLVRSRISRTYRRTAYALQILTVRDENDALQTLRVTEEHPFFVDSVGWTPARSLEAGDRLLGAEGTLAVVSNQREAHPQGVTVYNLEVEQAHTYFVLAEDALADAHAVWVHNSSYLRRAEAHANKDAAGHLENLDPATNAFEFSPRSDLAGDHILPQSAFDDAIAAYEAVNGVMPAALRRQVRALQNGTENLRLMDYCYNSSKQDFSALEWMATPRGRTVNLDYIVELAQRQEMVASQANQVLGGKFVPRKYSEQLTAIWGG